MKNRILIVTYSNINFLSSLLYPVVLLLLFFIIWSLESVGEFSKLPDGKVIYIPTNSSR
ncbi:MAG: hypothetical protein K8R25_10830 [Methanosarcinales archaeon]|nr:hypothetical protein [Methanosarcinales archaeon]